MTKEEFMVNFFIEHPSEITVCECGLKNCHGWKRVVKHFLSYNEVDRICDDLGKILNANYEDINLIAVANGGIIPAAILAYKLKDNVKSITIAKTDEVFEITDDFSSYLIVDDVCDTGKTFENLEVKNGKFDTVALIFKPWSTYKPTYFGMATTDWIVLPWEKE